MAKDLFIARLEAWMKKHRLPLMPVIWGITCLMIGVLILTGLHVYSSTEKAMAVQFNQQQLRLAEQAALGIGDYLREVQQMSSLLAVLPEIQNLRTGKDPKEPGKILQKFYESSAGKIRLFFLTASDGRLVYAYPPGSWKTWTEKIPRLLPLIQNLRPGDKEKIQFVFSQGQAGSKRDVSVLLPCPVFQNQETVGILGCVLDFSQISVPYERAMRTGKTGGAWMMDREG